MFLLLLLLPSQWIIPQSKGWKALISEQRKRGRAPSTTTSYCFSQKVEEHITRTAEILSVILEILSQQQIEQKEQQQLRTTPLTSKSSVAPSTKRAQNTQTKKQKGTTSLTSCSKQNSGAVVKYYFVPSLNFFFCKFTTKHKSIYILFFATIVVTSLLV